MKEYNESNTIFGWSPASLISDMVLMIHVPCIYAVTRIQVRRPSRALTADRIDLTLTLLVHAVLCHRGTQYLLLLTRTLTDRGKRFHAID